jgi:hypothetical protein
MPRRQESEVRSQPAVAKAMSGPPKLWLCYESGEGGKGGGGYAPPTSGLAVDVFCGVARLPDFIGLGFLDRDPQTGRSRI